MNPVELLQLDDLPDRHGTHLNPDQRLDAFERMWSKLSKEQQDRLAQTIEMDKSDQSRFQLTSRYEAFFPQHVSDISIGALSYLLFVKLKTEGRASEFAITQKEIDFMRVSIINALDNYLLKSATPKAVATISMLKSMLDAVSGYIKTHPNSRFGDTHVELLEKLWGLRPANLADMEDGPQDAIAQIWFRLRDELQAHEIFKYA